MNHEKDNIKELIIDEIKKTEELIVEYIEMTKPIEPDSAYGRISRMDAIINKSVVENSLRQSEKKLNSLKSALLKVDSPNFGKCKNCGIEIPLQRILIIPESPYCVNCSR